MPSLLLPYAGGLALSGGGLPADLDAAILARFADDATLPTLATGGIFSTVAEDGARMPYVVYHEFSVKPVFNGTTGYFERLHLRFNCYAPADARANAIGRALVAAFNLVPMDLDPAGGYVMTFRQTGGHLLAEHRRGAGSDRVWNRSVTFQVTVGRSRA
jgi:hypothetical protein